MVVMAFCVALSLAALPAWSSVYFIDSQNGSDTGDGTTTNTAWRTLAKVNATLFAAGDSVMFKCGGAWTGSLAIANSGTSNNPITYASYGSGNQPAIGVTNVVDVIGITGDWIVLAGLHIFGNGTAGGGAAWGVSIAGSHVTVTNCEINSSGAGVYTTGHSILVTHCNIHDMLPCHDDPGGDDDYGGNGVIMNTGASDIEVAYCRLVNLIGHSYDYGSDGGAVELWGTVSRVKAHHNYVNNSCGFLESGGLSGEPVTDVAAYYNVIVNIVGSPMICLHVGDGKYGIVPSNFRFHNNTCINGGSSYGMGSYIACSNNILVSSSLGGNQGNNYSGNPGFVNLGAGDYHLSSTATACIDNGVNLGYTKDFDGVAVPQGAAPDIGAYEFIPSTNTTLTVTAGTGGTTVPSGARVVVRGVATAISATPAFGYLFEKWTVASGAATIGNTNATNTTVTIAAPATVQANFAAEVTCAITAPLNGAVLKAGTNVTIAATASARGATVDKVEFFRDGVKLGQDTNGPYTCEWTDVAVGAYALTARAIDSLGVTGESAVVSVQVTTNGLLGSVHATGGTVTNYTDAGGTNWTVHVFTAGMGPTNMNVASGGNVELLVVAGGGGGAGTGGPGGGGGGGGLVYTSSFPLVAGTYAVAVGGGGAPGVNGTNSVFSNSVSSAIVAIGGGRGGALGGTGGDGGSGGGGGGATSGQGPAGGSASPAGQGYSGGTGGVYSGWGGSGGGGGAGAAGSNGSSTGSGSSGTPGGNGGIGRQFTQFSVWGSPAGWFAGGGGGGSVNNNSGGIGGSGGGGSYVLHGAGTSGTNGTGGGGGGGCWDNTGGSGHGHPGGAGGSGIVIVRYVTGPLSAYEQWRQAYFTAEELANPAVSGDRADRDHDGMRNLDEYWAGTDPTNPVSRLVVYQVAPNPAAADEFLVTWQSATGRVYAVQTATNLMTGFSTLTNGLPATPTVNVYTDAVNGAGQKFYRVRVE